MFFKTDSGSIYELDGGPDLGRLRRVSGASVAPSRMPPDGEWRTYAGRTLLVPGRRLFVQWLDDSYGNPAAPGAAPGTVTSAVVSIWSDDAPDTMPSLTGKNQS